MVLNLTKQQARVLDKILRNLQALTADELEIRSDIRIKFWKSAKKAKVEL